MITLVNSQNSTGRWVFVSTYFEVADSKFDHHFALSGSVFFLSGTYSCIKLSFLMHCCWSTIDIFWCKLDIFNQYFPHPSNTDEQKPSEFVVKNICITNHNIYVIAYCTITAKYKTENSMVILLFCLAPTQVRFWAISSLLVSSFLSFPFRY